MNGSKNVVGIEIAKRVFQLHWVDRETGEIVSLQLKREKFLEHFANRQSCLIGMEACGGAQHWARKLTAMGHQVKLLPGKAVKGFVTGNKNDRQDARAIWTAVQQPHVKAVAIKTEEQQAIVALHRMRSQLVKFRTAQINGLRGLLTEYGEVMPQGKAGVRKGIVDALARLADRLPAMVIDTLREQWARIEKMDQPGLVPRQVGTGGRIKLLGISKRGDTYLRTLLTHAKDPGPWVTKLRQRRPLNVVVVALANKMARTIWALLAHERTYQKGFVSQPA